MPAAVVLTDVLSYRIPDQGKIESGKVAAVVPAKRGDTIQLDQKCYDRFRALGAVADEGTPAADAAKTDPPSWGPPANAVKISIPGEEPTKSRRGQKAATTEAATDAEDGLDGAAPDGIKPGDRAAVEALTVPALKAFAGKLGVPFTSKDTKPTLVDSIVAHGGGK